MEFAEACCEVDFILTNLNSEDKKKIPKTVIEFFKENKSLFYKVNLTASKPLVAQELKDETKAFLQILNYKYFANQKQKEEFEKVLMENKGSETIFFEETSTNIMDESASSVEINENLELVIYKESKLKVFVNKIIKFFRKKER